MLFIVATNVVASWPPECQLTGPLTARANYFSKVSCVNLNELKKLENGLKIIQNPNITFELIVFAKKWMFL